MILIFSQKTDFATTQVIRWLLYFKKAFIRLNGDEIYTFEEISDDAIIVEIDGVRYNLLKCDSYWYRRDGISYKHLNKLKDKSKLFNILQLPLDNEYEVIKDYIYSKIENKIKKKKIGSFFTRKVNKLCVLDIARSIGFNTPKTDVILNKDQLKKCLLTGNKITKAASESIYDSDINYQYVSYTTIINNEMVRYLPNRFMASVIQEELKKKYELRVFYIMGKIFPCVIFSQDDLYGSIDCRRCKNFRYLPYRLPIEIIKYIYALMKQLNLETGSIDMVVNSNNEYVFLEVNPVGQFVDYGSFCNYSLDKEIAKIL